MTIYTRRGDHGETSLADGSRVPKASTRVEAYGTVDEVNSLVGAARACCADPLLDEVLHFAQQRLFNCSSSLATPVEHATDKTPRVSEDDVAVLERAIDRFMDEAGPLEHFVIEAGDDQAARLHVARAVCRRAERRVVALSAEQPVDANVLAFVNRLSDTLFAAARYVNAKSGYGDEWWDPNAEAPGL